MSSYVYLITEGVHDVAFLGRILVASLQFKRVTKEQELDQGWIRILPKQWPHNGSLRPSVPAPAFFQNSQQGVSVAIANAEGIDNMSKRMIAHLGALQLDGVTPDAVGAILDADSAEPPVRRFTRMAGAFGKAGLPSPSVIELVAGTPRVGVFILPGGGESGTLEDLLLECAATVYPTLGCRAVRFVDGLDHAVPELMRGEMDEVKKPAGRHKAVIAAMSAVLKPGKPIQATLEDHRWIENQTIVLPRIIAIKLFLEKLLGMPQPTPVKASGT